MFFRKLKPRLHQVIAEVKNRLLPYRKKPDPDLPLVDYPLLSQLVTCYSATPAPQILLLGDSVMERISLEDTNQATLGQMMTDQLAPDYATCCLAHAAYHPLIYYHLCRVLTVTPQRPRYVILPVNIRCFSPQWDLYPLWQFEYEINAINHYVRKPHQGIPRIFELKAIDKATDQKFRATKVDYSGTIDFENMGQFWDVIASNPTSEAEVLERKRKIFIFHYLHRLKPKHRKVTALQKMLLLLQKMDIPTLVYMTPINYEAGQRLAGETFQTTVDQNIHIIEKSARNIQNIHFVNLSRLLTSDYFFSHNDATEHLNQAGRLDLAKTVTDIFRQRVQR